MRLVPLVAVILIIATAAFAAEIREFDLKTTVHFGREMNRVS